MPSLAELATRDGYSAALRALHGFHLAWEPAIQTAEGLDDDALELAARAKLPLLERDLAALGIAVAPGCPRPGRLSAAAALGALYVLEGATLGGQVILRHAAPALSLTPQSGAAYFYGYGGATGECWRRFTLAATAEGERLQAYDAVTAGAVACFEALERWLATPGVIVPRPREAA